MNMKCEFVELSRYLVRVANVKEFKPGQIDEISSDLQKIAQKFGGDLKNVRISAYAIEFDLFTASEKLDQVIKALSKHWSLLGVRDLGEEQIFTNKQEVVNTTKNLLNEERYWECHEVMELIWRRESNSSEKALQHGIILLVSALVHSQKNEESVCLRMLGRTLEKLSVWKDTEYYGLDIGKLRESIAKMLDTVNIVLPTI